MKHITVACTVPLQEPIVLSVTEAPVFPSLIVETETGERVKVGMRVPRKAIAKKLIAHGADKRVTVMAPVKSLRLLFKCEISDDELTRLRGRHPNATEFVSRGRTRQEVPGLAQRVVSVARSASGQVLRHLRNSVGQWWLNEAADDTFPGNYLYYVRARWREPGGTWDSLEPVPPAIVFTLSTGGADRYLKRQDWEYVQEQLTARRDPSASLAMLADARAHFHAGETVVAVFYLNASVEWAVHQYLEVKLAGTIPDDTIEALRRQSYYRLLEDWVLPLARNAGLSLESEWAVVHDIRRLRNQLLHPQNAPLVPTLPAFNALLTAATSVVAKLLDIREPGLPGYTSGNYTVEVRS